MSLRVGIGLIGLLIYLCCVLFLGERMQHADRLRHRLTLIRNNGQINSNDAAQMARPLMERVIKQVFERLVRLVGRMIPLSKKAQAQLTESLRSAGIRQSANEYFATLATFFLLLGIGVFLCCVFLLKKNLVQTMMLLGYVLGGFYVLTRFMLGKKITQRRDRMENDMPEILDLLSVSVSAGLGFDQALQYVTERCDGDLSAELAVTQREIKFGKERNAALKALAERCRVESLRMFVSAIIQADTMGIAISNILQTQAESTRQRHKQFIEEKAAKLPVKILIPLVFFILPNIFIILLGPAVPQIMKALG